MPKYRIINTSTGAVIGEYSADSSGEALDLIAKDAGYRSYDDACEAVGPNVVVSECRGAADSVRQGGFPDTEKERNP